MPLSGQNRSVYSVSEVNALVRSLLEDSFADIWIEGEVSGFKSYRSGHWYFSLKDDDAEIRCAMFRGDNVRVRFLPSDGALVKLRCRISLYEQRGTYQAIVRDMQPAGTGELLAALAALREKLDKEGLLETSRKRTIPSFVRHLAIITSPSGAALRDIVKTLHLRRPLFDCTLLPVSVQGGNAAPEIVRAFESLATWPAHLGRPRPDLVLLSRGGGSVEDLWAFNLEPVARAIASCEIPVVTGIGHETDTSIADLVADHRAATPTAAASITTPDFSEVQGQVRHLSQRIGLGLTRQLRYLKEDRLVQWQQRLYARNPQRIVDQALQRLDDHGQRLEHAYLSQFNMHRSSLAHAAARMQRLDPTPRIARLHDKVADLSARTEQAWSRTRRALADSVEAVSLQLEQLNPRATLARGYAILARPGHDGIGQPITFTREAQVGETLQAHLADGHLDITVEGTHKDSS